MLKILNTRTFFNLASHKSKYFFYKQMETINIKKEDNEAEVKVPQEIHDEDVEKRYNDIMSITSECIQPEELKLKLLQKRKLVCYDGFEPSGRMHIAQGLLKSHIVNTLTNNGCTFIFWIADWFAQLNNKMSGDLNKIKKVGQYFIEVWKSCGMNMENVQFMWASDEINKNPDKYWSTVIDISRSFNINRIKRCLTIMGRTEGEDNYCSQILYPCMQCADIFFLNVDICQLGTDQRKVNMLAREYCDIKKIKKKPVILSHGMLPGLLEGQEKMSKSDENSAIFMDDNEADVNRKIKKGYCPPNVIENNPIFAYAKTIIYPHYKEFNLTRKEKNGGDKLYLTIEEMEKDYISGDIHPLDLKDNVALYINKMLQPVRDHFQNNAEAKKLLSEIKKYKVTK
ncbi:tyrosine--tRNA ligase, putative [Plasmodium vinckei lentum]|uniref:tyrosine--tRNA ligase n=3 Tax=Plasmodium vinckei TaxID=5860 RepID=A0A6V7T841_PLAVN|nr:tyrosine--tRNA ligase, putative [Plasmodium vinckei lentum]CAD2109767.1 tyrosine--tRNA ligase, putative [Plasmodium vinckei petteri]